MKKILEIANRVNKLTSFGNSEAMRSMERINDLKMRNSTFYGLKNSLAPYWQMTEFRGIFEIVEEFQAFVNDKDFQERIKTQNDLIVNTLYQFEKRIEIEFGGIRVIQSDFDGMDFDDFLQATKADIYKYMRKCAFELQKIALVVEEKGNKNKLTKVNGFDNLFPNEESKEFIIKSMIDLKIMNEQHEYILGSDRGFLKLFIEVMQENGKIPNMKQTPLCKIFANKFNLSERLSTMNEIKIKQERRKIESYLIGLKK